MSPRWTAFATLGAALGCGLIAGTFYAFSTFVMPALARLPPSQGVAAMQAINITVINKWFLGVLMGTAVVCAVLAATSLNVRSDGAARWRLAGSVAYVVGCVGVTMLCNVPRNDALAALRPDSVEAAAYWARFVAEWTAWNHVRTAAALAGAALLTLGLAARARDLFA